MIKENNMNKKIKPMSWSLVPIGFIASQFMAGIFGAKTKIHKINCENLKPPYIVLSNHSSMIDFANLFLATFPRRLCWICSIEEFNRGEWLMRHAGCTPKRKYTTDVSLLKRIKSATNKDKRIVVIHPEARYSLCGTPDSYSESLGKFVKFVNVPIVVFNQKGNFLREPQWAKRPVRKEIKQEADFVQVITKEDIQTLSCEEIQKKIEEAFVYDDFKYQVDNNIKLTFKDRAKNIHKILYKCPCCEKEQQMISYEKYVECTNCGAKWEMDELSRLHLLNQDKTWDASLAHIPNWYNWERKMVEEEIKSGNYVFDDEVRIEHLVNAKIKFKEIGKVHFHQDIKGIVLDGILDDNTPFHFEKPALSTSDVHIEFNFKNRGDAVEISDIKRTYFVYPINNKNILTKLHFAAETIYKLNKNKKEDKEDVSTNSN